jgi:acetyl esterase/lipase
MRNGLRKLVVFSLAIAATQLVSVVGAQAQPAPLYDVNYGATNNSKQILDVFPASAVNSPLVVLVHGGGWRTQGINPPQTTEAAALQRQGFAVFDINYDQDSATQIAFPMEINDVLLATQWAINHAASYNANPNDIAYIGGSAGGQLAGMAALEAPSTLVGGTVRGVTTLSGPMNLPQRIYDVNNGTATDPSFTKSLTWALGCTPAACTSSQENPWSPAQNVKNSTGAKWLLFNSTAETMPIDQMYTMAYILAAFGASVAFHTVPGTRHSFTYWAALDSDGQGVNSTVYAFISSL